MKATDSFYVRNFIKDIEYEELKKALEAHGGSYAWFDEETQDEPDENIEMPIVLVNDDYCGPTDVVIYKAWLDKYGDICVDAADNEYKNHMEVEIGDIEVGHLYYITELIPEVEGVDILSKNYLFGLDNGNLKCLTAPNNVTKEPMKMLIDSLRFVEIMFEYEGETYVKRIYPVLVDTKHYDKIWDYWTGITTPDGTEITLEFVADKEEDGILSLEHSHLTAYLGEDDDIGTPITNIKFRTSENESFKPL